MDSWQKEYITKNLPSLLENTMCNLLLISRLTSSGIISEVDIARINAGSDRFEKSKIFYEVLETRSNAYPSLVKALWEERQTGSAKTLLRGFLEQGHKNPLEICEIPIDHDKVLSTDVIFQGTTCKLKDIFVNISAQDIRDIFSTGFYDEEYIKYFLFTCEKLTLVSETVPSSPPFYIPRSISNTLPLNTEIFSHKCSDIFVFKSIERFIITELVKPNSTTSSSNQVLKVTERFILLDNDSDWDYLKKFATHPMHLIRFDKECKEYFLEETTGGSNILWQYSKRLHQNEKIYISEDDLIEVTNETEGSSGISICDTPGMGKSFLLASIARKIKQKYPKDIIGYIRLSEFSRNISRTVLENGMTQEEALHIIFDQMSPSRLSKVLLARAIKNNSTKIHVFFDGLDEVKNQDLSPVKRILKALVSPSGCIKLYVTSRRHLQRELEETLGVISYDMLEFNESNQLDFLMKSWKKIIPAYTEVKLQQFAFTCLQSFKKSFMKSVHDLMGVPLQCYMMAEVYSEEAKLYSDPRRNLDTPSIEATTAYKMYEQFFQVQFEKAAKHLVGECPDQLASVKEELKCYHICMALKVMLPELVESYALKNCITQLYIKHLTLPGILEVKMNGDKIGINFIHQTFAEYLVAVYLGEILLGVHKYEPIEFQTWTAKRVTANFVKQNYLTVSMRYNLLGTSCFCSNFSNATITMHFLNNILETSNFTNLTTSVSSLLSSCLKSDIVYKFLQCAIYQDCVYLVRVIKEVFRSIDMSSMDRYNEFFLGKVTLLTDPQEAVNPICLLLCLASEYSNKSMFHECCQLFNNIFQCNIDHIFGNISSFVINPLQRALQKGDYDLVEYLLNGSSLNDAESLYHCIEYSYGESNKITEKRKEICKLLKNRNRNILNSSRKLYFNFGDNNFHCTGPLVAIRVHVDLIKFLISEGADLFATMTFPPNETEHTILHCAAFHMSSYDFHQICSYIVENLYDDRLFIRPNYIEDNRWDNPLHYILTHQQIELDLLKIILCKTRADVNMTDKKRHENNLLSSAIQGGNGVGIMKELVHIGIDYNYKNTLGRTAIHYAAEKENLEAVKYLVSLGLSVNSMDDEENTPLILGAKHLDTVKYLVCEDADIYVTDKAGETIPHIAVWTYDERQFHQLVVCLFECDNTGLVFKKKNECGRTPLHEILDARSRIISKETADLLLNVCGKMVNDIDDEGFNYFLSAVKGKKDIDVLKSLIKHGADHTAKTHNQEDANMLAQQFNKKCIPFLQSLDW